MEPENEIPKAELVPAQSQMSELPSMPLPPPEPAAPYRGLKWIFIGDQGMRAGWSVILFVLLMILCGQGIGRGFVALHLIPKPSGNQVVTVFTARNAFFGELIGVLAMIIAAWVVALIEHRRILDYNLSGPKRVTNFFSGLVTGFSALSALVGALAWGGWLHFGPIALSGSAIFKYAAAWGAAFLLVGCFEEGTMRCFFLSTLTRGLNFWWAFGMIAPICGLLIWRVKGNGTWGVYVIALLGLIPCYLLHVNKASSAGFWQAAWVTSTFFGAGHTGNNGENWIGIFAAAFIGFVFCVSVKLTGSAWWAIGAHAAWDWSETYFYGTADSGFTPHGHYFTSIAAGNPLWSGGADGPEGSLLVIPASLLILAVLMVVYGRRKSAPLAAPAVEQLAG
jgi:hypothetical protein